MRETKTCREAARQEAGRPTDRQTDTDKQADRPGRSDRRGERQTEKLCVVFEKKGGPQPELPTLQSLTNL